MDKVRKDTDYSLLEQERKWKSQITEISQQHREELQNVCKTIHIFVIDVGIFPY